VCLLGACMLLHPGLCRPARARRDRERKTARPYAGKKRQKLETLSLPVAPSAAALFALPSGAAVPAAAAAGAKLIHARHVKAVQLVDRKAISGAVGAGCCKQNCLDHYTQQQVLQGRRANIALGETELTTAICNYLIHHRKPQSNAFLFKIGEDVVCLKAWLAFYGLKPWKYNHCRVMALEGNTLTVHGNTGRSEKPKQSWVFAWLTEWLRLTGDEQQHGVVFLPRFLVWVDIQNECVIAWSAAGLGPPPPSAALLRAVWRTDFRRKVRLPLTSDFGLCEWCLRLAQARQAGFANETARMAYLRDQRYHLDDHRFERKAMALRVLEAQHTPEQFSMFTIDFTRSVPAPAFRPASSVSQYLLVLALAMLNSCS
jgi:hypothetical protein